MLGGAPNQIVYAWMNMAILKGNGEGIICNTNIPALARHYGFILFRLSRSDGVPGKTVVGIGGAGRGTVSACKR